MTIGANSGTAAVLCAYIPGVCGSGVAAVAMYQRQRELFDVENAPSLTTLPSVPVPDAFKDTSGGIATDNSPSSLSARAE